MISKLQIIYYYTAIRRLLYNCSITTFIYKGEESHRNASFSTLVFCSSVGNRVCGPGQGGQGDAGGGGHAAGHLQENMVINSNCNIYRNAYKESNCNGW